MIRIRKSNSNFSRKIKISGYKSSGVLLLTTFVLIILGCTEKVLEYESVGKFQTIEFLEDGKKYIEISGLCMHSSMNIEKVKYLTKGNSMYIEIFLTLKRSKGSSGNLKEKIEIDNKIKNIYFGRNKKLIWNNKV